MKRIRQLAVGLLLCLTLSVPVVARAEDKGEKVFAIQERIFDRFHEVTFLGGYIPDDDFHRAFPLGASYTLNFNENLAWEVVRAQWVLNVQKDLRRDLESEFGVAPSTFDRIQYTLHSNVVLKPTYGKDAYWNRWVVNHETYVLAGAGVTGYERELSAGGSDTETAFSLSFGLGRRYFLSGSTCLNLEIRDLLNFKKDKIQNNVYLGLGLGLRFNLSPRKAPKSPEADLFRQQLKEKKDG
jgi:outer membrane beta-barrel protein